MGEKGGWKVRGSGGWESWDGKFRGRGGAAVVEGQVSEGGRESEGI